MKTVIRITKNTDNKYLNLYTARYSSDGKEYDYYLASRREQQDLAINGTEKIDAVRILPYVIHKGKMYVILIREFRHAVGKYVYSVPAGLVEKGEDIEQSAIRELREEIGAKVIDLKLTEKGGYVSLGLTDEKLACFEAQVQLVYRQQLDEKEDIKIKIVELAKLQDFLNENEFGLLDSLQIKNFLMKYSLQNERSKNEENSIIHW